MISLSDSDNKIQEYLQEFNSVLDIVRDDPQYLLDLLDASARRKAYSRVVDMDD